MALNVMKSNQSFMRTYNKEEYDRTMLAKFNAISHNKEGIIFHPISKAFSEAKAAGQEEVKDFIPYSWL